MLNKEQNCWKFARSWEWNESSKGREKKRKERESAAEIELEIKNEIDEKWQWKYYTDDIKTGTVGAVDRDTQQILNAVINSR